MEPWTRYNISPESRTGLSSYFSMMRLCRVIDASIVILLLSILVSAGLMIIMSGRAMCEYVADFINENGGPTLDPIKDIWEASPHGELSHVYHQFWAAWAIKNKLTMGIAGITDPVPDGGEIYDIIWKRQ